MELTPKEESQLKEIAAKIQELRDFLAKRALPEEVGEVNGWYSFLNAVKGIVGNANDDLGFVATRLAKRYLCQRHWGLQFDAAATSQSTRGLDVDVRTLDGKHIVAVDRATIERGVPVVPGSGVSGWFEWARQQANRADPIKAHNHSTVVGEAAGSV